MIREVAPGAEQGHKVYNAETDSPDNRIDKQESYKVDRELCTIHRTNPYQTAEDYLKAWLHTVHEFVAKLHGDGADCKDSWEDYD